MTTPTSSSESASSIGTCFVIGPIGDRLAAFGSEGRRQYEQAIQIWDYVVYPACQALEIEPVRADIIAEPGETTEQVFRRLRDDDLIIADATGGNANVMYELGLRHTKNKLTVQIGERERLPFDITVIRTIQFVRTETGLVEARTKLQEAIAAGIERGPQPVTATRVWRGSSEVTPEVPETIELEEQNEEPGFLDMLAETEEAFPVLARVSEELTAVFEKLPALTRADCRCAGPMRSCPRERLLEGSQGEGARRGRSGGPETRGGRALRRLALDHQAMAQAPTRRRGPVAEALAGAHPLHPRYRRGEEGFVGATFGQRRRHPGAPLRAMGGAARPACVGGDDEPRREEAGMDLQKKPLVASERDEQARSSWREHLSGVDPGRLWCPWTNLLPTSPSLPATPGRRGARGPKARRLATGARTSR